MDWRLVAAVVSLVTLSAASCASDDTAPSPVARDVPTAATTAPQPETVAPDDGFVVPPARRVELETAGLGWMLDVEYPQQPPDVPWPTASWPTGALPDGVDPATVRAILDEAFRPSGDGGGTVHALLAVSGGRLVVDAYNGWDPAAPHPSWSMAKSITGALLGILVDEGRLDPFEPAPVPEWSDPADPRHGITIDDLLHMRSGLAWQEEYGGTSDVITMLFGDARSDRAHYAASKPLATAAGTTFAYSTGTSMIVSRIIASLVGSGDAGTTWARTALFDPLGISAVEHDLDGAGVISGGSKIDMSAHDFARFGLLYLRGGAWDGRQLVPREWVDYSHLPRPSAPDYGAHWWVDDDAERVAFFADGYGGQLLVVIPALDLVVVALADEQQGRSDAAAWALVDAFADIVP